MSLLTRISVPSPTDPEAEDIFSSALTTIFTDDAINSWGSPGATITYHSPRFGPIHLRVPVHPDEEQGRKLFAHYLWNAGVLAADLIEVASSGGGTSEGADVLAELDTQYWDVRGQRVLEIGAATALPSLIAALSAASSVTVTDHPSSPALTAGGIDQNVKTNLFTAPDQPRTPTPVSIHGYTWGSPLFYDPSTYGRTVPPPDPTTLPPDTPLTNKGYPRPHKIIVADCLWMPSQHANIVQTILDFLPEHDPSAYSPPSNDTATDPSASTNVPAALVTAGFHTGRAIVRNFFALATGRSTDSPTETGPPSDSQAPYATSSSSASPNDPTHTNTPQPSLKLAHIYETDMEGNRRPWIWDDAREGEGKWEAKRWCVVGVLVRAT